MNMVKKSWMNVMRIAGNKRRGNIAHRTVDGGKRRGYVAHRTVDGASVGGTLLTGLWTEQA
jgi:hypothetical protein